MRASRYFVLLMVCPSWPAVSTAAVLNVPTPAYPTIQSAIDAAVAGDEVVVAPGVYPEAISFGATAMTVHSSGGPDVTTIDASGTGSRVVTFQPGSGPTTLLSGFTITGGQLPGSGLFDNGGGIRCDQASPTITDCIVEGNLAYWGGGLEIRYAQPAFANCIFRNNRATFNGGAVACFQSAARFDQCTFQSNQADSDGGAMVNVDGDPVLNDCVVDQNTAGRVGGGIFNQGSNVIVATVSITGCTFQSNSSLTGGGILGFSHGDLVIRDSTFAGNAAQNGGAIAIVTSHLEGSGCVFDTNTALFSGGAISTEVAPVTITDSLFKGNTAFQGGAVEHGSTLDAIYRSSRFLANSGDFGGAVFARDSDRMEFVNCLFDGNHTLQRGGAFALESSSANAVNCTMASNTATIEPGALHSIGGTVIVSNCILRGGVHQIVQAGSTILVSYSNIQGSWPGSGNIDADARFVDALGADGIAGTDDDNLRLLFDSPVIDAGKNAAVPSDVTVDLDGNPRFLDDPATVDTGSGTPPLVDMGAYEFQPTCGDGVPDPTEECDDGNSSQQDGCLNNCVLNVCGDGFLYIGVEECDDGNVDSIDGCSADCVVEMGACCFGNTCSVGPQPDCTGSGGSFFGFYTTCDAPDADGDGLRNECDGCPNDGNKIEPGVCGCGVDDAADSDADGVPDCNDQCPGVDDTVFAPECVNAIPAVSAWGLVVLTLLLLVGIKIGFGRKAISVKTTNKGA